MVHNSNMENWIGQAAALTRAAASRIATATVIMFLFWLAAAIVYRLIVRIESHLSSRRDVLQLIARSVNIALLILGALTALGTAGVNVSALVAGLGLSGFALGFALRDILSNVLAGFLILFYRPFSAGDQINVLGLEGRVVDVDLRY